MDDDLQEIETRSMMFEDESYPCEHNEERTDLKPCYRFGGRDIYYRQCTRCKRIQRFTMMGTTKVFSGMEFYPI